MSEPIWGDEEDIFGDNPEVEIALLLIGGAVGPADANAETTIEWLREGAERVSVVVAMPESVIRKLPKSQRRALDNLSIGLPAQASQRTLTALADRGLIVGHARMSLDRFGVMTWME